MIFLVYHFDMEKYHYLFGSWGEIKDNKRVDSEGPSFPEDYEVVAAVEADNIEHVFEKTNHIDRDWTENEGVIPTKTRVRSTSCGDVVVDGSGNRLICASMGWEKI